MTRAGLVTPPGMAGIAVVQVVGSGSLEKIMSVFRGNRADIKSRLSEGRLVFGAIYDENEPIDRVILAFDKTKQIVDINCHGGPRVVQRLLLLLQKNGVEITSWQQLYQGRSLREEVALTLPRAKTPLAVRAIASQYPAGLGGWISQTIEGLKSSETKLDSVRAEIALLLRGYELAKKLLSAPTVVITGVVNAGKSTLANALAGKAQSITADLPGTTRDWTAQLTSINGLAVNLIDTAGRRDNNDKIEQQALAHADEQIVKADLVVLVAEARGQEKQQIADQLCHLESLVSSETLPLVVVNKCDLAGQREQLEQYLYVSALHNTNLDRLGREIITRLGFADFDPAEPLVFTQRQFELLSALRETRAADKAISVLKRIINEEDCV